MGAIPAGWTASHPHDDSDPSVLQIKVTDFEGENHVMINDEHSDFVTVWDGMQLAELLAGLIAAGHQAGYNMDDVLAEAGILEQQ